jgi:hypothetical protein
VTEEKLVSWICGKVIQDQGVAEGFQARVSEIDSLRNATEESREDAAYLFCKKCGDLYLLRKETLEDFKGMVGIPKEKIVSQECGTYFVTEDCADEQAKITLVEPVYS